MEPNLITSPSALRLADTIQRRIDARDYAPGQWLPAERQLATEFGVHRRVVQDAIALLSEQGLLVCRPSCRPVVAPLLLNAKSALAKRPEDIPPAGARLVAFLMWDDSGLPGATSEQRIFRGFNRALLQAGYHGLFLETGQAGKPMEEYAAHEAAWLAYAVEHRFAGIVFYPYAYRSNRQLLQETSKRLPLVLIDRQILGVETDYVGVNNLAAILEATNYLLAQGHRRIALVAPSEPINTVQDRIAGYRAGMRQAGLSDLVLTVDSTSEWALFDHLLRQPPAERPSAILCVNDATALLVAERMASLGLRVPDDVSLVGFDDLMLRLPQGVGLSSVAQPFEEIGATAARLLLERIATPSLPAQHIELPTTLSLRESIGAIKVPT